MEPKGKTYPQNLQEQTNASRMPELTGQFGPYKILEKIAK